MLPIVYYAIPAFLVARPARARSDWRSAPAPIRGGDVARRSARLSRLFRARYPREPADGARELAHLGHRRCRNHRPLLPTLREPSGSRSAPAGQAFLLLFFVEDLTYYLWHRASHEVRFLWAAHENHHSSQYFNLSTALRQSWTTPFTVPLFYWWLPLAGFHPAMIATQISISLIYQFWIHTELIDRMPRWFEAVFNTPSHHRVHHGANVEYLDRNHAGILIVWDRLFGTFEPERERVGLRPDDERRHLLAAPPRLPRMDRDDPRGAAAGAARDATRLDLRAAGLEPRRLDADGAAAAGGGGPER
jgi:hypothetical protein